jgi:hypothetical protein
MEEKRKEASTTTRKNPDSTTKDKITKRQGNTLSEDLTNPEETSQSVEGVRGQQDGHTNNNKEIEMSIDKETMDELLLISREYNIAREKEESKQQEYDQENVQDRESIASKKTLRNHNRNNQSEEESIASSNEYQDFKIEDDENTVDSSNSTQYNKQASDKQIPPRCIRYQLGINLTQMDIKLLQKEFEGSKEKTSTSIDTFTRIREHLKELITEIKNLDRHAQIISWKDAKTYNVLEGITDNLPSTAAGLGQFFEGMRLKRDHGRQHLRFRLHASKNANRLEAQLSEWARLSNYSFYRCIIQAEHSPPIGWLLYSSQCTNTYHLSTYLQRATGFEWSFCLRAITKLDEHEGGKPVQWKDRLRALLVHVPTHKAEVAVTKISNILKAKPHDKDKITQFYKRFLFIQQEQTMALTADYSSNTYLIDKRHTYRQSSQSLSYQLI